jgi:hypothetical protein
MRTFWTYRDVGASELEDVCVTDLYTHTPRLKPDLILWNKSRTKRWSPPQLYWLTRIVSGGFEAGLYEYTMSAMEGSQIGALSQ